MKVFFGVVCCLLLWIPAAHGQTPVVGVYNPQQTDCNIVDTWPGLLSFAVIVTNTTGATAVAFSAPPPPCFTSSFLSDSPVFPVTIGNSVVGVSIGFGACLESPIHVLTINYFVQGITPACCYYTVSAHPEFGEIQFTDCDLNTVAGASLTSTINGDASCPCGDVYPIASIPFDPSPVNLADGQPFSTTLGWNVTHPENGPFTFDVYFGAGSNPPLAAAGLTESEYDPGLLAPLTTYKWWVVAEDNQGHRETGPAWRFTTAEGGDLSVSLSDEYMYCGPITNDTLVVDLVLGGVAPPIDAIGVDLSYDPSIMAFLDCERGGLVADWLEFECIDMGSWVRIGGSNIEPVAAGTTGTLARVRFVVDVCGIDAPTVVDICPTNLTEDLVSATPTCGALVCDVFEGDGDLTDDGRISPEDALCVFKSYMSFPNPPAGACAIDGWDARSDVDCSREITPGDALCVFDNWLDGSCTFCGGVFAAHRSEGGARATPDVSIGIIVDDGDVVSIPIHVEGARGMRSFGFDIRYPEFIGFLDVERIGLTADFIAVDAAEHGKGHVRAGGYSHDAVERENGDIVVLEFKRLGAGSGGTLVVDRFVDDLAGAQVMTHTFTAGVQTQTPSVSDYRLYQNHPNPFNPVTAIRYDIPNGRGDVSVTLSVYDVGGGEVRRLVNGRQSGGVHYAEWDGTNASGAPVSSGIYFCVLRAGGVTMTKKMVLLK